MHQSLPSLLFPEYRRRVLGLLLLRPDEALHGREIARRTGLPADTITRELTKPAEVGLLKRTKRGNQQVYSVDTSGLIFTELAGIQLQRHRSWCVSTDPAFAAKAADVIGLYLPPPPQNALVLSVDEKPSIQALERARGYVQTSSGKIVQGMKSTYKRHGTVNLFAALEVRASGAL